MIGPWTPWFSHVRPMIPMRCPIWPIFEFMGFHGLFMGKTTDRGWPSSKPAPAPRPAGKTESVRVGMPLSAGGSIRFSRPRLLRSGLGAMLLTSPPPRPAEKYPPALDALAQDRQAPRLRRRDRLAA